MSYGLELEDIHSSGYTDLQGDNTSYVDIGTTPVHVLLGIFAKYGGGVVMKVCVY